MSHVEDGYEVVFDLREVAAHAEAAAQADPWAAIEIASDGSCLRFSVGQPGVLLVAHGEQPPAGGVAWMRQKPLTYKAGPSQDSELEQLRTWAAGPARWLEFRYSPRVSGGWSMGANAWVEQRRSPYNVPGRYAVVSMTWPDRWQVVDLHLGGLGYREGPGKAPLQADEETMRELCARLNREQPG
ncbi:hypothetical protein [Microbispora sp. NBRC 16548]|uniref:hypothetical protein n=1 Tax=Microbispora sp. NBRC 16548 TaxID=3030994 RepID=UPI0024A339B0|nr:hypothetical protein [Microbispora sp. NBRC 16548]GLX06742.1 hypothetical protein Misp03_36690 [Microbispora sp. NBRC 16548]